MGGEDTLDEVDLFPSSQKSEWADESTQTLGFVDSLGGIFQWQESLSTTQVFNVTIQLL